MTTPNKHLNWIHYLALSKAKERDSMEAGDGQFVRILLEDVLSTPTKFSPNLEEMNCHNIFLNESFGPTIALGKRQALLGGVSACKTAIEYCSLERHGGRTEP